MLRRQDSFHEVEIKQPQVIHEYDKFMNGVDRCDQLLGTNNVLRKTVNRWTTLFFHMIVIALVNVYILYQCHR